MAADFDTRSLKPTFAAKCAHVSPFSGEPLHQAALPLSGMFYSWSFALIGSIGDFFQEASEILP
jgi:hypothetical protein